MDQPSRRRCDCTECFYCDAFLAPRHEHDHFPIPDTARGRETVSACMNCHELKDRSPFRDWPLGLYTEGMAYFLTVDILQAYGEKAANVDLVLAMVDDLDHEWPTMPTAARLVYAKLNNIKWGRELLRRWKVARGLYENGNRDLNVLARHAGISAKAIRRRYEERPESVDA